MVSVSTLHFASVHVSVVMPDFCGCEQLCFYRISDDEEVAHPAGVAETLKQVVEEVAAPKKELGEVRKRKGAVEKRGGSKKVKSGMVLKFACIATV